MTIDEMKALSDADLLKKAEAWASMAGIEFQDNWLSAQLVLGEMCMRFERTAKLRKELEGGQMVPAADPGSGMYRTVFTVEVLSDGPVSGYSLKEIAREITTGDSSGHYWVADEREISRKDMAHALEMQSSDPSFLLGDGAWVYKLGPGDEVRWTDPDGGGMTLITIRTIKFHGDIVRITTEGGSEIECLVGELS